MKISKTELKSIVKECLVELLNEGLAGGIGMTQQTSLKALKPVTSSPLSDNIRRQAAPDRTASPQLKEAIKREAGGNKIMEAILADTAASTLPSFLQNDGKAIPVPVSAGGGVAERVVAAANPEDLFGDEVSSKWASLAFADSPTKK